MMRSEMPVVRKGLFPSLVQFVKKHIPFHVLTTPATSNKTPRSHQFAEIGYAPKRLAATASRCICVVPPPRVNMRTSRAMRST